MDQGIRSAVEDAILQLLLRSGIAGYQQYFVYGIQDTNGDSDVERRILLPEKDIDLLREYPERSVVVIKSQSKEQSEPKEKHVDCVARKETEDMYWIELKNPISTIDLATREDELYLFAISEERYKSDFCGELDETDLDTDEKRLNYLIVKVIKTFYDFCRHNRDVENNVVLGLLILHTLPYVNEFLYDLNESFDSDKGRLNLEIRSGLQFLITEFAHFQIASEGTLCKPLQELAESEDLLSFTEKIETWLEEPVLTSDGFPYPESYFERPDNVPLEHTWWKEGR